MNAIGIGALLVLTVAMSAPEQNATQRVGGISGSVHFPSGAPSSDATVQATTVCKDMGYSLSQSTKTDSNGAFYILPFAEATCNTVRLTAKDIENFWLETGNDVFYGEENGTAPIVDVPRSGSPITAEIAFGNRGGLVTFRVRDVATDRYIWAGLSIERRPAPGTKFGSMVFATGRDGSPDTLLLPVGQYEISVDFYSCDGNDYFTTSPPRDNFTIAVGQRLTKNISIDVRLIKPMKSKINPLANPCRFS
jgi:hypothetical protein